MNKQREELAELIQDVGEYIPGSHADDYINPTKAADAVLAAGYSKPRTITTVEELDALPVGSVVLSGGAIPRIKAEEGYWLGDGIDVDGGHIIRYTRFATLLYSPDVSA